MAYKKMAYIYDQLMKDAPYEQWVQFLLQALKKEEGPFQHLVDLGCGTGSISIPLSRMGYSVTGIDLSEDMLAVAKEKADEVRIDLSLFQQDMRKWTLPRQADVVFSFCDSFNYLLKEEDIQSVFRQTNLGLVTGGLFLFDMHTPYKIKEEFAGRTFTWVEDDVTYIWNCHGMQHLMVEHELIFFVKEKENLYRRWEEVHFQRAYPMESVIGWLEEAGFGFLSCTADFSDQPPTGKTERIFYKAKKIRDIR
ncbi:methyltransferase domain-containing protein [Microaerobacter geothermalis]|uniref:class I SAM-dependent DNA methyltransferase n=1 Tax=Microaerobacter geothermalis TaxID=674972 RepID=UPI001F46193D|nr:class I SAM-dependent methyltransferase [Microaerobacter geothermalis]MCF6092902.1 methyltransferase domain-containing protein [Microaerobacter geothermalis]